MTRDPKHDLGLDGLTLGTTGDRGQPLPPRFLNYIRPALRGAGRVCGPPIDTVGYADVRAILLLGENYVTGRVLDWGLEESDRECGPFEVSGPVSSLSHVTEGISIIRLALGAGSGRQRWLRFAVSLGGAGCLVYGVFLELIPARQTRAG